MLPGENQRERVLSTAEEEAYLAAANGLGQSLNQEYQQALLGIRATMRGEQSHTNLAAGCLALSPINPDCAVPDIFRRETEALLWPESAVKQNSDYVSQKEGVRFTRLTGYRISSICGFHKRAAKPGFSHPLPRAATLKLRRSASSMEKLLLQVASLHSSFTFCGTPV